MLRTAPLLGAVAWIAALVSAVAPAWADVRIEDARRFASVFAAGDGKPSAEALQVGYIEPGSRGVEIFTPNRIQNATNLAARIAHAPAMYRRAVEECLPVVEAAASDMEAASEAVRELLGKAEPAPIYVVFGGASSGGTASADGIVLGLEILCDLAAGPEGLRAILIDFAAHETVHVHQAQISMPDLWTRTVREGAADYFAEQALGRPTVGDRDREAWAFSREAELWRAFSDDASQNRNQRAWIYNAFDKTDRPNDLAYWIGKRITGQYLSHAADRAEAIKRLLAAPIGLPIVEASGYGQTFGKEDLP